MDKDDVRPGGLSSLRDGAVPSPPKASIPDAWASWEIDPPQPGQKVVIVCDDGCSSSLAMMSDDGPLDGEDAFPLGDDFLRGAIWMPLPENYPLGLMEQTDADWY